MYYYILWYLGGGGRGKIESRNVPPVVSCCAVPVAQSSEFAKYHGAALNVVVVSKTNARTCVCTSIGIVSISADDNLGNGLPPLISCTFCASPGIAIANGTM